MIGSLYLCVAIALTIRYVGSSCMHLNYCNGHGKCNGNSCECYEGYGADSDITSYRAPDCSARTCPSGPSWGGKFDKNVLSHSQVEECSGRGTCDRKSGLCTCAIGFSGSACQRSNCPNSCSGNGRCMNMAKMALNLDAFPLTRNETQYNQHNASTAWDYASVQGCVCDSSWKVGFQANETQLAEYFGADCSLRRCPSGDNPRTSVDETDCYNKTQSYDGSTTNVGAVYNKCHIDCSNQGICDYSTGYCSCFPGYYGPNCGQTDAARANQYSPDGIYFNLIGEDGEPVPQTFERFNSEDVVDVFAFNNN